MTQTIVITGASDGIGAELAKRLAPQEVQLVLAARRAEQLNQIANEIGSHALAVVLATYRSVYSASKAALNSLTANVRMDLREYPNIHISLVIPGPVSTAFAKNALGGTPVFTGRATKPQTADQVAAVIEAVIHNPVAKVYTNPVSAELVLAYYRDVAAYKDEMYARSNS